MLGDFEEQYEIEKQEYLHAILQYKEHKESIHAMHDLRDDTCCRLRRRDMVPPQPYASELARSDMATASNKQSKRQGFSFNRWRWSLEFP